MGNTKLTPELLVTDLGRSLEFWCGLIGFQIAYDRKDEGFSCLHLDNIRFMLEQISPLSRQWIPAPLEQPLGRGINFEITVSDIQPIISRLCAARWPLFMDVEEKTYRVRESSVTVRQFVVQDPDGYLLRLSQNI